MLIGRKDALALSAIAAGIAAASPWLAGNPAAAASAAVLPGIGGALIAHKKKRDWLNRVDTEKPEDFVLPSDPVYPELENRSDGLRFGYTRDKSMPLEISNQLLARHTAIIGQSGVGKTTLGEFLLWQQIVRGGGFIFIDAKLDSETRDKLGYMAKAAGRAHEMYLLNVDDPENSNSYNPILEGDADEVASRLLNLLPSAENNPGADFYRQQAMYALTVLTGGLKSARRRYDFSDLAILLQSDRALEGLLRLRMEPSVRMTVEVFLNHFKKPTKTGFVIDVDKVKTQLGGMAGRIAQFSQGKFGKVFNTYTPEIDLTDIVKNNKILYVMLPTMGKDQAALNLGKMILSDLRTAVYNIQGMPKDQRPSPPFLVFADEMGSYVMPGIARLFEQARSAGICMVPAFQTFANLRSVSPDFEDIIIGNTWNKVFFKFASKDSPETAAEIIGKTKKFIKSLSASESEGESALNLRVTPQGGASKSGGIAESWRESQEYKVEPDHLKRLGMGEAVVVSGARTFHIRTPMLVFPEKIPEFKVSRFRTRMAPDELGLDLKDRYKEFMVSDDSPGGEDSAGA